MYSEHMKYKMTGKQKKMCRRLAIASAVFALSAVADHIFGLPWQIRLAIYLIPYVIAGYDVLKTAGINIIHGRVFDEKFLMMVATAGALGTGEYPEADAVLSGGRTVPEHCGRALAQVDSESDGHKTRLCRRSKKR